VSKKAEKTPPNEKRSIHHHLRVHYGLVALLYTVGLFVAVRVLSLPENQSSLVTLLSSLFSLQEQYWLLLVQLLALLG
jgi:hypothetical protein